MSLFRLKVGLVKALVSLSVDFMAAALEIELGIDAFTKVECLVLSLWLPLSRAMVGLQPLLLSLSWQLPCAAFPELWTRNMSFNISNLQLETLQKLTKKINRIVTITNSNSTKAKAN